MGGKIATDENEKKKKVNFRSLWSISIIVYQDIQFHEQFIRMVPGVFPHTASIRAATMGKTSVE